MRTALRFIAALVAGGATAGCYHYTAELPGVLDTRSDGSTADVSPAVVDDPDLRREGVTAVIDGAGVQTDGAHVSVEDRHFFGGVSLAAPGSFLLSNDSAAEEMKAALGDAALREVRVGHSYTGFDLVLTALVSVVPCVPLLLAPQPYTFAASGERIAAGGAPPTNRPVAPPVTGEDVAPDDVAPDDVAPADVAPADSAPADSAPADSAPADSAPADSAPADSAPDDSAPDDNAAKSAPDKSAPKPTPAAPGGSR